MKASSLRRGFEITMRRGSSRHWALQHQMRPDRGLAEKGHAGSGMNNRRYARWRGPL
ncbi:MAG: hypothetical protein ACLUDQ_11410 [Bilophila wadsworthia]